MHGYDNERVERDGIVNRLILTQLILETNNNKLIQVIFFRSFCIAKSRQSLASGLLLPNASAEVIIKKY